MLHPDTLFYPLDCSDADLFMEMFSGASIIGTYLDSDDSGDCTGISFRMSDGRKIHLRSSHGIFLISEEGLAGA